MELVAMPALDDKRLLIDNACTLLAEYYLC